MTVKVPCIFCGSTDNPSSDEHVLPRHWKDHFPNEPGVGLRVRTTVGKRDKEPREHVTPFDAKIPHVCKTCNGGWMRLMDEAIKPLVFELADDPVRTLTQAEGSLLTEWATKVALVRSYVDRHQDLGSMPGVARRYYADHAETLPRSLQIGWCDAHVGALSSNAAWGLPGSSRDASENTEILDSANVISIKVGRLFLQCGLSTGSRWSEIRVRKMLTASRRHVPGRLVPLVVGRDFEVPVEPLTDLEIDLVAEPLHLMKMREFAGQPGSN